MVGSVGFGCFFLGDFRFGWLVGHCEERGSFIIWYNLLFVCFFGGPRLTLIEHTARVNPAFRRSAMFCGWFLKYKSILRMVDG